MQHVCKTQHKGTTNPKGTFQGTPIANGIHCHGLNRRDLSPLKQRKQVCTYGSMHADGIYFLHSDKIQESRGCHEIIHRQHMLCIWTFKEDSDRQLYRGKK